MAMKPSCNTYMLIKKKKRLKSPGTGSKTIYKGLERMPQAARGPDCPLILAQEQKEDPRSYPHWDPLQSKVVLPLPAGGHITSI
jgi:hypothetical protein